MAFPSVHHARHAPDRGPTQAKGWFGTGTRFEAGFDCGPDGGAARVSGSARRCQRHLAGYLRQHRDLLSSSAESRVALQAALEDLTRWDRHQHWSRQVLIEDLRVTYWLRAERAPAV